MAINFYCSPIWQSIRASGCVCALIVTDIVVHLSEAIALELSRRMHDLCIIKSNIVELKFYFNVFPAFTSEFDKL